MLWRFSVALVLLCLTPFARAQFHLQDSHSTANLRGIHSVDGNVAWASGTDGTILRTVDGGSHWQRCATPPGADRLDFRGVWAWDAMTAIALSSGPEVQARLFRTNDGCAHWIEEARNTDKDGFWDTVAFQTGDFGFGDQRTGVLIGDPVGGRFHTRIMVLGHGWFMDERSCKARPGEAAFAASNSAAVVFGSRRYMVGTGGRGGPRVLTSPLLAYGDSSKECREAAVPVAGGNDSSGVFSLAFRDPKHGMAVGGDYKKPEERSGTAATTADGGLTWAAASEPPHGYRSSVAWSPELKAWIAVGTNGSDVSRDDGMTWQRLEDGNWNAISLPYIVGPKGSIGKLQAWAVK